MALLETLDRSTGNPAPLKSSGDGGLDVTLLDGTLSGTTADRDAWFTVEGGAGRLPQAGDTWDNTERGFPEYYDASAAAWRRDRSMPAIPIDVLATPGAVAINTTVTTAVIDLGAVADRVHNRVAIALLNILASASATFRLEGSDDQISWAYLPSVGPGLNPSASWGLSTTNAMSGVAAPLFRYVRGVFRNGTDVAQDNLSIKLSAWQE